MNQKNRQTTWIMIHAVAFIIAVWPVSFVFSGDEMESRSDEPNTKFVDDWFERLSQAESQTIAAEFAAMVETSNEHDWTTQWVRTVAIRMVDENVHLEHAAEYLLDQIETGDDHPTIDLNQAGSETHRPFTVPSALGPQIGRGPCCSLPENSR